MTCTTRDRPKPWERSRGLPWHPVECSDVMVAQRVVDELDLGSRGGHDADVAPAAGRHPVADATDPGVAGQDLHRLDRGPTDQSGALFGDPAAVHVGVGLAVLGGQPGPAGQLRGVLEPGDVADLGDEDRTQDRPDPGDLLDRQIAGVAGQPAADDAGEQVDLEVQVLDQPPQRPDPAAYGPGSRSPS